MTSLVPTQKAIDAVLGAVVTMLQSQKDWRQQIVDSIGHRVEELSKTVPQELEILRKQELELNSQMELSSRLQRSSPSNLDYQACNGPLLCLCNSDGRSVQLRNPEAIRLVTCANTPGVDLPYLVRPQTTRLVIGNSVHELTVVSDCLVGINILLDGVTCRWEASKTLSDLLYRALSPRNPHGPTQWWHLILSRNDAIRSTT